MSDDETVMPDGYHQCDGDGRDEVVMAVMKMVVISDTLLVGVSVNITDSKNSTALHLAALVNTSPLPSPHHLPHHFITLMIGI